MSKSNYELIELDRSEIEGLNRHTGFYIENNTEMVRTLFLFGRELLSYDQYLKREEDIAELIKFLTSKLDSYQSLIKKERREFKTYKSFGSTVNPYDVLHELYKGGKVARGYDLISQDNFKDKSFSPLEVRRWITWLEYHDIIKFNGQMRFAKYTWHRAKIITKEMLKKERGI